MSHTHVVLYTEHVLDMWYSTLQIGALHSVIASARPRAGQLLERVRVEGVHTSRFEDLPVGTVLLLPALLRDAEDARAVNARRLGALLCRARVEGGLRLRRRNAAAAPELDRRNLVKALGGAAAGSSSLVACVARVPAKRAQVVLEREPELLQLPAEADALWRLFLAAVEIREIRPPRVGGVEVRVVGAAVAQRREDVEAGRELHKCASDAPPEVLGGFPRRVEVSPEHGAPLDAREKERRPGVPNRVVREPVEGEAVGAWGRGGVGSVCKGGVRRGRDSFFLIWVVRGRG